MAQASAVAAAEGHRHLATGSDRPLRVIAVAFVASRLLHGVDHVRRGTDVVTELVVAWGGIQFVIALFALALVLRRNRWAPFVSVSVGVTTAIGVTASHLVPHWSAFSDPFTGEEIGVGVNAYSWLTALLEIGAALALAVVGLRHVRSSKEARPPRQGRSRAIHLQGRVAP